MSWFVLDGLDHPVTTDACLPYELIKFDDGVVRRSATPRGWLATFEIKSEAAAFIAGRNSRITDEDATLIRNIISGAFNLSEMPAIEDLFSRLKKKGPFRAR